MFLFRAGRERPPVPRARPPALEGWAAVPSRSSTVIGSGAEEPVIRRPVRPGAGVLENWPDSRDRSTAGRTRGLPRVLSNGSRAASGGVPPVHGARSAADVARSLHRPPNRSVQLGITAASPWRLTKLPGRFRDGTVVSVLSELHMMWRVGSLGNVSRVGATELKATAEPLTGMLVGCEANSTRRGDFQGVNLVIVSVECKVLH